MNHHLKTWHIAMDFMRESGFEILDCCWKPGLVAWDRKTETIVFLVVKGHERKPSRMREFPSAKHRKAFWRQATSWRRCNKWRGNYRVDAVHVCFDVDAQPSIFHRENVRYSN